MGILVDYASRLLRAPWGGTPFLDGGNQPSDEEQRYQRLEAQQRHTASMLQQAMEEIATLIAKVSQITVTSPIDLIVDGGPVPDWGAFDTGGFAGLTIENPASIYNGTIVEGGFASSFIGVSQFITNPGSDFAALIDGLQVNNVLQLGDQIVWQDGDWVVGAVPETGRIRTDGPNDGLAYPAFKMFGLQVPGDMGLDDTQVKCQLQGPENARQLDFYFRAEDWAAFVQGTEQIISHAAGSKALSWVDFSQHFGAEQVKTVVTAVECVANELVITTETWTFNKYGILTSIV